MKLFSNNKEKKIGTQQFYVQLKGATGQDDKLHVERISKSIPRVTRTMGPEEFPDVLHTGPCH
jgi:hypothetical protein